MKYLICTFLTLITITATQAQGINFEHGTFAEALAKAKAENKMVFMDCYTTWCGPCKVMSKNVFPQQVVGDYINANFVSLKMDMEKGEGIQLVKTYNVKAFPTLLFMDANGKVLNTKVGGVDAKGFIAEAKIAYDPAKQFSYIEQQYQNGNRDLTIVSSYIKGLYEAYKRDEVQKVGIEIIPTLTKAQYYTEEGFTILGYTGVDFRSEPYNYVLNNKEKFIANEKIGQQSVDYLIGNAIRGYVIDVAKNGTMDEFNAAIEKTKEDYVSPQQEIIENHWLNEFYLAKKQYIKWFDNNIKQAEAQTDTNTKLIMYINPAYKVAVDPQFESSKDIYNKAIKTTEKLKTLDAEFLATYFCLASLYKKIGNKEKALLNINEFINKKIAKGEENDKYTADLKAEIENM